MELPYHPEIPLVCVHIYIYEGNKITYPERYLHFHFHSGILCNTQDMETPKCPSLDNEVKEISHTHIYTCKNMLAIKNKEIRKS